MDLNRDKLLKDLAQTLMDRTIKAAEDMAEMCVMVKIPRYEFDQAAAGIYLYMFMTLIMDSKPTMTANEIGQIVSSQFTYLKKKVTK